MEIKKRSKLAKHKKSMFHCSEHKMISAIYKGKVHSKDNDVTHTTAFVPM